MEASTGVKKKKICHLVESYKKINDYIDKAASAECLVSKSNV